MDGELPAGVHELSWNGRDGRGRGVAAGVRRIEAVTGGRAIEWIEADEERLRALGPGCRWVHIATHGVFRLDNPMFSAIQPGDSRLTLFDLY